MKYYLLIILAAGIITSCSHDEIIDRNSLEEPTLPIFEAGLEETSTRAELTEKLTILWK